MEEKFSMRTAQDILQFHFSPIVFQQFGESIIPSRITTVCESRIGRLQKIVDAIGAASFQFSGSNLIPQIYRKFKKSIHDSTLVFERRELRTLTYSFTYFEHSQTSILGSVKELEYALKLLDNNWRDSFLIGLIDCFLKNWSTKFEQSLSIMESYIDQKLDNYLGTRSTLVAFKNNKRYFNIKNGDLILGDTIAKLNKPLQDATKILGVPESWFVYSYFSKVIVTYYERRKTRIFEEFEDWNEVLLKHNSSVTNKRLLSKIILQVKTPEFMRLQDRVRKIAFTRIGDPNNASNWTVFDHATETERNEIIEARRTLNEWITKEFINVFFNVCINDEKRKKFWLRYASNISSFIVYGSLQARTILKQDKRISDYVDARFQIVSSKKEVSAFLLYIGEYMLIEFSDAGYACCAYKLNSPMKPSISKRLQKVEDLRNSALPLALYSEANYYYTNDEGRLFHNQNWEEKFSYWLHEKVLI